jgi:myo-inositol-1(or 4)-monophosphatase
MSTSPELSQRIAAGRDAVLSQVAFFHAQFGRATSHWKHDGSRVTDADIAISTAIFDALRAKFPGDDLFSEELAVGENPFPRRGEWSWVLDPIDGTNNYALGIPVTAISLGLLRDGEPVYGFLYDLGRRSLFHGGPGQGVWDGDERLQPTFGRSGRHERIVATHSPIHESYLPLATTILTEYKLRGFGSGALHLTYAALGMIDACMDFTVKVWDIAAAAAIARETGAPLHFWSASPFPLQQFDLKMKALQYCAGSPEVVAEMKALAERVRR